MRFGLLVSRSLAVFFVVVTASAKSADRPAAEDYVELAAAYLQAVSMYEVIVGSECSQVKPLWTSKAGDNGGSGWTESAKWGEAAALASIFATQTKSSHASERDP